MTWLHHLIIGLLLFPLVTSLDSNTMKPLNQNNLSVQAINEFERTLAGSRQVRWVEERVDNRLSKDLLLPLWPSFSISDGSGEGSGLQQSLETVMPSTGHPEIETVVPEQPEKPDFEERDTRFHSSLFHSLSPPIPQRLLQQIDEDDQDIILADNNGGIGQDSAVFVELITQAHSALLLDNKEQLNKEQLLSWNTEPDEKNHSALNPVTVKVHSENVTADMKKAGKASHATTTSFFTEILRSIAKPETSVNNDSLVEQHGSVQGSFESLTAKEEHKATKLEPEASAFLRTGKQDEATTNDLLPTKAPTLPTVLQAMNRATHREYSKNQGEEKPKWFESFFGSIRESELSDDMGPCLLGPCMVSTGANITQLQWDDMKRTLAFAWELHVFGSAALFFVIAVFAAFGTVNGAAMLHPFREAFILSNILLLLAGLLRFLQFVIDPYGTRNILSHSTLVALYNQPVPLLLWAQATLALLIQKVETLNIFPASSQALSFTGVLAVLHCTLLLMGDLFAKLLYPALPLLLQTLTICWGLPLSIVIFSQSAKQIYSSHRTPLPRRSAHKHLENSVRRVLLLAAFLGTLSCVLQTYGFLWLYELLGDWRRFGWGWWVVQLWARVLELAWSFCLLLLGSHVFWRPQGRNKRVEQNKKKAMNVGKSKGSSDWSRVLERLPLGSWRKPDRDWAKLLPNNWKMYQSNSGLSVRQSQASPAPSVKTVHDYTDIIAGGVHFGGGFDPKTSLLSSGLEWQEQDCVLSLIEFDLRPPSPVNFSHTIDNALHHAHLLGVGALFTPSSLAQNDGSAGHIKDDIIPPNTPSSRAYRWALDNISNSDSTQNNPTSETQLEISVIEPLAPLTTEPHRKQWEKETAIPRITEEDYASIASGDDLTSL